jgi:transcriptional regulator with XRE-family HTH domain
MAAEHMAPALARAARGVLNWTMEDLAKRVHISPTTVRDFETGARAPRWLTLNAIATAFEDEGIEFVGGEGRVPGILVHRPELLSGGSQPRTQPEQPKGQPKGRKKAT